MGKIGDEMTTAGPETTDRIQEDIRDTESDISNTLHTIEDRLAPKNLVHDAADALKDYSIRGYVKVTEACRRRPVPAALIGAAAAAVVVGLAMRRPSKRARLVKKSAAILDALPKRIKRHPEQEVKRYVTLGRVAVTVASALATFLLRPRAAGGLHRLGHEGRFPATVK
ncbi:DUF3618 domain-containing protein [Geomesophilobacter sediminis]|uniref:DUF3618 domain-containing protein n=1 Tax=Geomesophilobacter sediminis TaxID=2798584 RepID=A0A8J7LW55_9BACT|nr:DUF3618 domain-containing protein [Geomesophilobacter sediminis]MBJ6726344.1 DUF3618 domain-containing protein [Geomesophilobacter sediminis]